MKWLNALLLVLAFCIGIALGGGAVHAQPQVTTIPFAVSPGASLSANVAITGSAQTITLPASCTTIIMWSSSGAANCYVTPTGSAATSSNAIIYSGSTLTLKPNGKYPSVSFLGASATGTMNYICQ